MKRATTKVSTLLLLGLLSLGSVACNDDEKDEPIAPVGQTDEVVELSGVIKSDMTLSANKKYLLKGFVYVEAPAKLTIEPGTIIKGHSESKGTLIIERGAQIFANGTVDKPIVFTSNQPKGTRKAGDWGGLVILGKAPGNAGSNVTVEGSIQRQYGGDQPNDNSGVLKYVRIEFAGIAFTPNNEINGLTLAGVGNGTEIDYVQVSFGGDDAFEWFGGTVNAKHLIAYKTVDDMFDTDNGFSGNVQYVLGIADPKIADSSKSNGFESDNNKAGDDANPLTKARFSNVSLFGPLATSTTEADPNFGSGIHFKNNTQISVYNSVIAGWPKGILLNDAKIEGNATSGAIQFKNNVIAGNTTQIALKEGSSFDATTWFANNNNVEKSSNGDIKVEGVYVQSGRPAFIPATGSDLLTGGSFEGVSGFETSATFRGAFGTTDWTEKWANFDPQNTDY